MPLNNKKIIYIACPGHSGSTLIEYYLSSFKGCIGLGEVYRAINEFHKGNLNRFSDYDKKTIDEISFWQKQIKEVENFQSSKDQYTSLYNSFLESEDFSEYDIIVDSSKSLSGLKTLSQNFKDNLHVIVVYKDIRSWIISQHDNRVRKERPSKYADRFKDTYTWISNYRSFLKFIRFNNLPYTEISYDMFCLNSSSYRDHIIRELQMNGEPDFTQTNSINVLGNRMKKSSNVKLEISYDYRWLRRNEWLLPWLLLPPTFKNFNYQKVWDDQIPEK